MYIFLQRLMALIMLVILLPLFLVIAVMIKVESKGPVIFKQVRVGKDSNKFVIYKFRSMRVGTPNVATKLLNNPYSYITKTGNILRRTSLDELPQLVNIIKGDMLFVGPRPLVCSEYELIDLRKKKGVDKVYPGITGWAQVNGRDELVLEEKVKYDSIYVENRSILFDIKIVLLTFVKVIKREGISEGSQDQDKDKNKEESI